MKNRNRFIHTIKVMSVIIGALCATLDLTNAIIQLVIQAHLL